MSEHDDEHEHQPQGFAIPFSFFGGPPPSQEQIDRQNMEAMANGHEVRQFIHGLDEFQLNKVISLIKIVDSSSIAAYYYIGVVAEQLDTKYGKCMTCGKKHDEELAHLVGDGGPAESSDSPAVKGTKKYDELMYLYNMEQDDDGSDRVMCKGCGKWYVSLADRMLRASGIEGCSGCIEKNKWG